MGHCRGVSRGRHGLSFVERKSGAFNNLSKASSDQKLPSVIGQPLEAGLQPFDRLTANRRRFTAESMPREKKPERLTCTLH